MMFFARLVVLLLASTAATAAAQEVEDIEELSLTDLLDVPVTGASKYEQTQRRAPSAITVIGAHEIARHGYRTLGEVLRAARGLYVSDDRNYGYLGVRGFSIPGDYNSRVLLLIDGHRVNDAVYSQAPLGFDLGLDMRDVERVEVVRGPSSSVYGSNAFFGVVNLVTKKGKTVSGAGIDLEAGSLDTNRVRLSYGDTLLGDEVDVYASGSFVQSGGNETLYFEQFDTPATRGGVARDLDDERAGQLFLSATYGKLELRALGSDRRKQVPTASYGTVFGDPGLVTTDKRAFVDATFRHELPAGFGLMARAAYDYYEYLGDYPFDYQDPDNPDPFYARVINRDETFTSWLTYELQLRKSFGEELVLLAGAEYLDFLRAEQRNFDVYRDDSIDLLLSEDAPTRTASAYLQVDAFPLPFLGASAGVRYDNYLDSFGGTVNPRFSLLVAPTDTTNLKLLYGTAFRAPNAYERIYYGDGVTNDGANLDPERVSTVEALVEQFLTRDIRLSLAGYYYEVSDLLVLSAGADDVLVFDNIAAVQARGVELELEGRWDNGVHTRASYAWQRAIDESTQKRLVNSPQHLAKLALSAPLGRKDILAGLSAQLMGPRKTRVPGTRARPHALVDLNVRYESLLPGLAVAMSMKNALDARYGDPMGDDLVPAAVIQNGRTFWLTASYALEQ